MTKTKSKGINVSHISKYKEEIENLKEENKELGYKLEIMEKSYQASNELFDMQSLLSVNCQRKKVNQSFEIIDLKEKISELRLDIFLLVIGIIFISLLAIFK